MAKINWDADGKRFYETGVSKGVLFVKNGSTYEKGVPWNGLINITESPTGAEPSAIYADNIKYLTLMSIEELEASIEAYTYPDEFAMCDGSAAVGGADSGVSVGQQERSKFALCYQTKVSNDEGADEYKIHIIYGCMASPSEQSHDTVNDSPEAMTFSWDLTTDPVAMSHENAPAGVKPTASITIDSRYVDPAKLATIVGKLYGLGVVDETDDSELLLPDDIIEILDPAV